jgi:hypothetical protein
MLAISARNAGLLSAVNKVFSENPAGPADFLQTESDWRR